MSDNEPDRLWAVLYEKCRICGKKVVGVAPLNADLDNLECSQCGNMTSEAVNEEEWKRSHERHI